MWFVSLGLVSMNFDGPYYFTTGLRQLGQWEIGAGVEMERGECKRSRAEEARSRIVRTIPVP